MFDDGTLFLSTDSRVFPLLFAGTLWPTSAMGRKNAPSEIMSVHSAVLMFPDKNILDAI